MATTKKPTEATETAEQVQADNSRAESVKVCRKGFYLA